MIMRVKHIRLVDLNESISNILTIDYNYKDSEPREIIIISKIKSQP